MKKFIFSILPVAGMILMMSACSSEETVENTDTTMREITLSATADFSGAQTSAKSSDTRVSWNPNGTVLNGSWDASDIITVTNSSYSANFTSANTADGATTADFKGTADFKNNDKLYAFYPAENVKTKSASIEASSTTQVTYDFSEAASLSFGESNLDGLKNIAKYYPMYASQTYNESGETKFKFINAASIVKLRLQAPEDGTVIKVSISGPTLKTGGTLDKDGKWTETSGKNSAVTPRYAEEITKYSEIDLYFITLPNSNVKNATVTIDYQDGKTFYYTKLPKDVTMEAGKEYVYTRGYNKVSPKPEIGYTYYSDGTWGEYDANKDHAVTSSTSIIPVGIICSLGDQVSDADKKEGFTLGYVMATSYPGQSFTWVSTDYTNNDEANIPNKSAVDATSDIEGYTYQKAFMENHKNNIFQGSTYDDSKKTVSAFYDAYYAGDVDKGKTALNLSDDMKATTTGWFLPSAGQVADMLINLGNLDMTGKSPRGNKDRPEEDGLAKMSVKLNGEAKLVLADGNNIDQNKWPHHLSDAMWYAAPNNYDNFSNTAMWTSSEVDASNAIWLNINGETWQFISKEKTANNGLVRPFLAF